MAPRGLLCAYLSGPSLAAQVLLPLCVWSRMGYIEPEEGHTGARSGVVRLSHLQSPSKQQSPCIPPWMQYYEGLRLPLAQLIPCWQVPWVAGGLAMSRVHSRRSCRCLGGDPWLITAARTWHVTQHNLRGTEHFVPTLCTSLPACCPLIPPEKDFPLPPQLPVPGPGGRVIIYFLPQATPSDLCFDLQPESPKHRHGEGERCRRRPTAAAQESVSHASLRR